MLFNNFKVRAFGLAFDIDFHAWVTMVDGHSAEGKTLLYNVMKAQRNPMIKCFNHGDADKSLRDRIEGLRGKLIVIDNADIILKGNLRARVSLDDNNQYLIFGRNPYGYHLAPSGYAELKIKDGVGRLIFPFM